MLEGDLVQTKDGRLGIIKAYYEEYDDGYAYPWRVWMFDNNWTVEFFRTNQIEVISESR